MEEIKLRWVLWISSTSILQLWGTLIDNVSTSAKTSYSFKDSANLIVWMGRLDDKTPVRLFSEPPTGTQSDRKTNF